MWLKNICDINEGEGHKYNLRFVFQWIIERWVLQLQCFMFHFKVSCLEAKKGKKGKGKKHHRKSSEKSASASIEGIVISTLLLQS